TDEQRTLCGGAENMVPIWKGSDPSKAKACIDIFEFPNRTCELPYVWGSPSAADAICKAQNKRLCSDKEGNLACSGDPNGGPDRTYAYGDNLDLNICNTNKPHGGFSDGRGAHCSARTAQAAWDSCSTDTEPVGAFPQCRSRFGVFDQAGNVAEMMTRLDTD